jgi:hypothetical protein
MHPLVRFLFDNPLLLFLLVAWIGGAIARLAKAKQARQAAGGAPALPRRQPGEARRGEGPRSADEVAAEIRRALGLDGPNPPARREPAPVVERREPAPVRRADVERPPTPVVPTTQQRRLELHGAPHVGEQIQRRPTFRTPAASSSGIGGLGGRNPAVAAAQERRRRRFLPADLAQAIVTAEVLGPPVALRGQRRLF